MTFLQLQYFLKVYETRNVNTAATELYLTRSALSKSLHEMEEEFGGRLFERTASGLVPTEMGEALRENGLAIISLMDKTDELMHSLAGKSSKTVHIGVTPTTGVTIFPRLYQLFAHEHPEIHLIPIEGGNAAVQNFLESGRMDVCFTTYSEVFPDRKGCLKITDALDYRKLYDTELVFCVQKEHPLAQRARVSVSDILREPMVFLKKPLQREAELNHRFMKAGGTPLVVFRASQLSTARKLVSCGMAASVQLRGTLDHAGHVVEIPLDPPAPYANVLVWNRACACKQSTKTFLDFCRDLDFRNFP
jgi:DNA-binding transcriptional LysR family regulator